ncbi:MAG: hypothetical protein AAF492_05550 [Verrucomicrobiota bacterium]
MAVGADQGVRQGHRLANRMVVTNRLIVRSLNGPASTEIRGRGPLGSNAVRCAYVADHAQLIGFTLFGGHTLFNRAFEHERDLSGGGVYAEFNSAISNCIVTGNACRTGGGGIRGGLVRHSTIVSNTSQNFGGGLSDSRVSDCLVGWNTVEGFGGGLADGTVIRSVIVSNRAFGSIGTGGGMAVAAATNCHIFGNQARIGGGMDGGQAVNSLIRENMASDEGGGAVGSSLQNCVVARNRAGNLAGGTSRGTTLNSIIYFNSATNSNPNTLDGNIEYSCSVPEPVGAHNISAPPRFVNIDANNYRLKGDSPCIDQGLNLSWMPEASDFYGNPRIFHKSDIGIYEFHMTTELNVLLQGPYEPATDAMQSALTIPFTSPYEAHLLKADAIPSNVTDWVLLQLLTTNQLELAAARSAFLRSDGTVLNERGEVGVQLEVSPGHYHIIVKHRNHVSGMSAEPVAFTNLTNTYDFTPQEGRFHGGTNGAVELKLGAWGLIAGDADGDGRITEIDRRIWNRQLGRSGYLPGDFNLDGTVTTED